MQFSFYFFGIIIHILRWSSAQEALGLYAVSSFPGVENYYHQLKRKSSKDDRIISVSPKEGVSIRRRICRNIFRSNFFDYKQEKLVNVKNYRIQNELKLKHPEMYKKMYIESQIISRFPIRIHYDNPYRLHTIVVPGNPAPLKEYVFLCPVRAYRSRKIKAYYISAQYDVNDGAKHFNITQISGRFIFQPAPKSSALTVYALAEESAKGVLTFNIDMFYFLKRGYNVAIEKAEDDPICRLSNAEKLRLCTTLFSAFPYKGKVKFVPGMDAVDTRCEKREIKFFTDVLWNQHFNGTSFSEWMIVCKAMVIKNGKWIDFHVSRGYGPNRIFVYKLTKGKLLLYHHSVNVGVVKE